MAQKQLENIHDEKQEKVEQIEDEDDMFSEKFNTANCDNSVLKAKTDNATDAEGYYRVQLGESLDEKYVVYAYTGQGVFSNVVRVNIINRTKDTLKHDHKAAVKIIRKNDLMHRSALKEMKMVKILNDKDPKDRYHVLRFFDKFYHKQHLCLVFEPLYINLREVLKKFGGGGAGINLRAVRAYSQQLFLALKLLRKCRVIHADIKPDNILVTDEKCSSLKLCDFGSAFTEEEIITDNMQVAPLLVSRFYRPPEIILGGTYDYNIDLWSVAVSLYELFTSKVMFPGRSNNHMLKLFQDMQGKCPVRLMKNAKLRHEYFDDSNQFMYMEKDTIDPTKERLRLMNAIPITFDLRIGFLKKVEQYNIRVLFFVGIIEIQAEK